jgi:hypothetical protein
MAVPLIRSMDDRSFAFWKWLASMGFGTLVAWVMVNSMLKQSEKNSDAQRKFIDRVATANEKQADENAKQTQLLADVRVQATDTAGTNRGILASQKTTQDLVRGQDRNLKRMADRLEIVLPSPQPAKPEPPKP